ncbi:MAG: hypothetical protein ACI87W_000420 [Halieaceae bacterium]|jgi:hypothetical protein
MRAGSCTYPGQYSRHPAEGSGPGLPGRLALTALLLLPGIQVVAKDAPAAPPKQAVAEAAVQSTVNPAAISGHRSLSPYKAVYKTSASGLSIKLRRSLTMDASGDCRLTSEGNLLVAGISEVSVFALDGNQIQPKSYIYQLRGPVSRRREVHFDSDSDVIRSLYKKEWYLLPNAPGTLDRMSQQEQLRLLMLNDPTPREDILFRVADGRKIKEYRFMYRGESILETPMGDINTLHFERDHSDPERRSSVWIAPEWDYLMVRTLHVDEGKATEANLISVSIGGVALGSS